MTLVAEVAGARGSSQTAPHALVPGGAWSGGRRGRPPMAGLSCHCPAPQVPPPTPSLRGKGRGASCVGRAPGMATNRPRAVVHHRLTLFGAWAGDSARAVACCSQCSPQASHPSRRPLCLLPCLPARPPAWLQEVSFQWFKTHLLAKGAVEKLEVANKQMVKVRARLPLVGALFVLYLFQL